MVLESIIFPQVVEPSFLFLCVLFHSFIHSSFIQLASIEHLHFLDSVLRAEDKVLNKDQFLSNYSLYSISVETELNKQLSKTYDMC